METDKHYLKVGTFMLLTILAALIFSVWISGIRADNNYMLYRIRFNESVSGLDVGGPVKFRGVNVGKVDSITIDPADMGLIRVDVKLLNTAPIKTDTVATLKLQGITGAVYIELSGTTPEAPNLARRNDGPPEIPSQPSTLTTLMDRLPEILDKISHIADQAGKLLSDRNIGALSKTFGNVQKASHNANELTEELKEHPSRLIFGGGSKDDSSKH